MPSFSRLITRNIPLESPEAYQERLFKEAMEGFEKFRKRLDAVKK
jgi:hypothetical protein